jgi:hypothetical protein
MARTVPTGLTDQEVHLFYAVKLEFDSGDVNLWNGTFDTVINGDTYIGAGQLLAVSDIEETSEIAARGMTVTLDGLDSSIITDALTENYTGRPASLLFGTINSGTFSAYTLFKGRMDVMTITEGADSARVTLTVENNIIDLSRPRVYRYTSEEQKLLYPSDYGLDYVADLQDKQIFWGRPSE